MGRLWRKDIRIRIVKRDEGKCIYCGIETTGVDHVIPISEGGLTIPANGVCCCKSCNSKKGSKLDESWIVRGLQRLIQHGEDIGWVANIRPDVEPEPDIRYEAIEILLSHGLSIFEIMAVMGLSRNEVMSYVIPIRENEFTESTHR